jgi:hypothetical protein
MWTWLRALDSILRGETTRPSRLREGQLDIPASGLAMLILLLGALYGFCMGWFALFNRDTPEYMQVLASMIKVPALFLLTLVVTFPSLYVFNALVGSRLGPPAMLRLLVAALAVTLAVLASFGPIVAFFSLTTTSYPFMILLNVAFFSVSGTLGLTFLLQTLHRLTLIGGQPVTPPTPPAEPEGALDRIEGSVLGKNVKAVFTCWVVVFALVGAQMSWVLRPFIGYPGQPFQWFRVRESHFFEGVRRALVELFS